MPYELPNSMQRWGNSAFQSLIALFACGFIAGTTGASVLPTVADIPAAQALGAAQDDTVWMKGQAVGTLYGSGTLIRGRDHDYVLTAAHLVKFPSGTFAPSQLTVGNGTSYFNDLGSTSGVTFLFVSPTYVPGNHTGLDYAFLRLDVRISAPTLKFSIAPTPSFSSPLLFAGFGIPGVMSGEPVQNTGNVMGFYGSFTTAAAWIDANDSGNFTGEPNSGGGSSRDSGGSVKSYNSSKGQWENLGTIVAGSSDGSGQFTSFLNYNNVDAAFIDYLNNTVRPVATAPKPPSVAITASPASVQLSCADLSPTTEYRIMRSPTLSGWQEAHSFTATTANYSWSEAVSPGGKMFYRLEWGN